MRKNWPIDKEYLVTASLAIPPSVLLILLGFLGVLTDKLLLLIPVAISIIIFVLLVLFKNFHIGTAALLFLIPFEQSLDLGVGGGIIRYLIILSLAGAFIQAVIWEKKVTLLLEEPVLRLMAMFTIWSFLSAFWSSVPLVAVTASIGCMGNLFLASSFVLSNPHWLKTYWSIFLAGCVVSILSAPFLPRPEGLESSSSDVPRFTTGGQDPNDLSGILLIGFAVGLYTLYPRLNSQLAKNLMTISLLIVLLGVVLTLSRTGLLSSIPIIGFLIIRNMGKVKPYIIYFPILILVSGIVYSCNANFIDQASGLYLERLASRFSETGSSVDASGLVDARSYVWDAAIEAIKQNFFGGVGSGNLPYVIDKYSKVELPRSTYNPDIGLVAHNIVLSVWSELGLIGIIVFAAIFVIQFRRMFILAPKTSWGFSMLICLLLIIMFGITLSWENKKIVYIVFGSISLIWNSRHYLIDQALYTNPKCTEEYVKELNN